MTVQAQTSKPIQYDNGIDWPYTYIQTSSPIPYSVMLPNYHDRMQVISTVVKRLIELA